MAHAEREGSALIVQHSDRLARGDGDRAQHLVEIVLWARKAGVTLKSVQDPQTFDGMGLVYAALMGDRNHEDSARKSKSVRDGLKRRADSGRPVGAVPIGYIAETIVVDGVPVTRRIPDPGSSALLKRMFALAVAGHTPGDISRTLNAEGVRTRRGVPWSTRAVRWVIENRDYTGQNGYPALVDEATWDRAQRPKRTWSTSTPRPPADDFVLGGMVVCFDCGAAMRSRRASNGKRTYRCSNAMEGRNSCTTSRPVPAEDAERELIANAVGYLPTLDDWLLGQVAEHRAEQAHTERALTAARNALQGTERRLERLLDDYERLPEAEARLVLRRATSVEAERDEAERRVRDLEAVVSEHELDDPDLEAAHDLYRRLAAFAVGRLDEASSPAEVRAALSSLISEVRLGFEDGELVVAASLRVVEQEPQTLVKRAIWTPSRFRRSPYPRLRHVAAHRSRAEEVSIPGDRRPSRASLGSAGLR